MSKVKVIGTNRLVGDIGGWLMAKSAMLVPGNMLKIDGEIWEIQRVVMESQDFTVYVRDTVQ